MSIVKISNGSVSNYNMPSILDEFFNKDVFNWGSTYTNSRSSMPAVNIKETAESFNVEMAVPGIEKKILKLNLTDTRLPSALKNRITLKKMKVNFITGKNSATSHFTEHSICQKMWWMLIRLKQNMKMDY